MSFVTEMEEVLDDVWPVVQDQNEIVKTVTIVVENLKYIQIRVDLEDGNELQATISWEKPISALIKELKGEIGEAAQQHTEEIDDLMGSVEEEVAEHKKDRLKIKKLDPTPLEELAMQAE